MKENIELRGGGYEGEEFGNTRLVETAERWGQ